jgi:acetyltransferase-like isoleucine patch superfamily enzyme
MLLSRTGSLQYTIASIVVLAALIAILIVSLLAWRRSRSGTPAILGVAASPYRFIRLCTKDLQINVHLFTNDHVFYFGNGCTSNTVTFELGYDGASIVVGEDCMFSVGIAVRAHDDHGIIVTETGQTLNAPGNVHFEPHVWVGLDATILKGVRLGFGYIVATRALVTRNVPPKTLVAGLPARVFRTNVSWVRERVPRLDALTRLRTLEHRVVS